MIQSLILMKMTFAPSVPSVALALVAIAQAMTAQAMIALVTMTLMVLMDRKQKLTQVRQDVGADQQVAHRATQAVKD
jgi:hypothetical protein